MPAGKTGPKRPKDLVEFHRAEAARLSFQGLSVRQIAAKLGVAPATVQADREAVRKAWRAEQQAFTSAAKAEEVAELMEVRRQAKRGWWRSRRDAVRRASEHVAETALGGGATVRDKTTEVTEGQAGDPRFLSEWRQTSVELRKLLGLDAAQKHELTGAGGKPIAHEVAISEDEALAGIRALYAAVGRSLPGEAPGPDGDGGGPAADRPDPGDDPGWLDAGPLAG